MLIIKGKCIFIHAEAPTYGLDGTESTAEAKYLINFSRPNRKCCVSLHYNAINSLLFLNARKIDQFKASTSEITKIFLVLRKNFNK